MNNDSLSRKMSQEMCEPLTFIEQSLFGLLSIDVYIYIYNYTNIHKMTYFFTTYMYVVSMYACP